MLGGYYTTWEVRCQVKFWVWHGFFGCLKIGLKTGVGVTKTRESVKKLKKICKNPRKVAKGSVFSGEKELKRARRARRNWNHGWALPLGTPKAGLARIFLFGVTDLGLIPDKPGTSWRGLGSYLVSRIAGWCGAVKGYEIW